MNMFCCKEQLSAVGITVSAVFLTVAGLLSAGAAFAWIDTEGEVLQGIDIPDGMHAGVNGEYVMNVGELHVNITNFGTIGSRFSQQSNMSDAPSGQWPAGSGNEYLWCAGLWVGGEVLGQRMVSTGEQREREFRPRNPVEDTIYEAIDTILVRPSGNTDASGRREPMTDPNDDEDTYPFTDIPRIDEEILNGYDDDDDGLIDEDFGQIGNQMLVCTMYDNTALAIENYPDHAPLHLQVVQKAYAWEADQVDDFVAFEYFITNIGVSDINDVYIGFYADADIGARDTQGAAEDDMAAYWEGMVEANDGSFVPVSVGYMWDAADSPLEGYFGILFLGHDTDPAGVRAPMQVGIRSFNSFSGQAAFDQGGDPINDAQRYELMSEAHIDPRTPDGKKNDFRFLVSAGPFAVLSPEDTLRFQAAMVVGSGLSGLQKNCAEAVLTWEGNYIDKDAGMTYESVVNGADPIVTGTLGRETMICQEDVGQDVFENMHIDLMDTTCVDPDYVLTQPSLPRELMFIHPERGLCTYVNMDNCVECARQLGRVCTGVDGDLELPGTQWNCWDPDVLPRDKAGCTGVGGAEYQIHWLVGMAPPAPGMRLWPADNRVHVYWTSDSEISEDIRNGQIDFESYRIWRADNWTRPFGSSIENGPESTLWQLIAEYDTINTYTQIVEFESGPRETVFPLGVNTGFADILYRPVCLDDTVLFADLSDSMAVVVAADVEGDDRVRPSLYDANGKSVPRLAGLLKWAAWPAVLDTFWAMIPREANDAEGIIGKKGIRYYEYIDRDIHNGFLYFYSVTATDHRIESLSGSWRIIGPGQSGDPGSSFNSTRPGGGAQSAEDRSKYGTNIYVSPNPATRDALADFQQFNPNSDDPTGVRVMFANLPAAHNTIQIYSLSGDLIKMIPHDGTGGYGQATWNLVSRNGQEVVSGIYLYSVESDDDRFDPFIGKFVIIR